MIIYFLHTYIIILLINERIFVLFRKVDIVLYVVSIINIDLICLQCAIRSIVLFTYECAIVMVSLSLFSAWLDFHYKIF